MGDMFEVIALMATPAALLLAMRWIVIRQNRAAERAGLPADTPQPGAISRTLATEPPER